MAKEYFEARDPLNCSICLDQLQDPVTIPCGHNYCMDCIKDYWDKHGSKETGYGCPQCRKTFTPKPILNSNTMFAEVMEMFKKTGIRDSSPAHFDCPGPMEGKICNAQKFNTVRGCLQCEDLHFKTHPSHHYDEHNRGKHTVIVVSAGPQSNVCSLHNRLLGAYCGTNPQFICAQCLQDAHKGHEAFIMVPKKKDKNRAPLTKNGHRTKCKTSGHGKRKSNKSTCHRHRPNSGSHAKSGQQISSGHRVHFAHGESHGAGHKKRRDESHLNTGHGHNRNWH